MTGRKLYDTLCDQWAKRSFWARNKDENGFISHDKAPLAWSFLTHAERTTFSEAAARLTPKKRKSA